MTQRLLFGAVSNKDNAAKFIGRRLYLEFKDDSEARVTLYHNDVLVKTADLADKVAKRFFVVEAVELGAIKSRLAGALNISRQTIHNYLETKNILELKALSETIRLQRVRLCVRTVKPTLVKVLKGTRPGNWSRFEKRKESGWIHKPNSLWRPHS